MASAFPHPGTSHRTAATRKPRLLFRLSGEFLLRFAERQFLALLFQLPPRFTRFCPEPGPFGLSLALF